MPNPKVIRVRGARTHNLKNVSVEIPLNAVRSSPACRGRERVRSPSTRSMPKDNGRYVESFPRMPASSSEE